jgi:hypothetical protein
VWLLRAEITYQKAVIFMLVKFAFPSFVKKSVFRKAVVCFGYGTAAYALSFYALNGSAHLAIIYPAIAYGLARLEQYWAKTPKVVRQSLAIVLGVVFFWIASNNAMRADAIFFDNVLQLLSDNINVFGAAATGLANTPKYIVALLKIIGIVGFAFVIVLVFKAGNDEDESRRQVGRIFKWMAYLLIGAVMIDILFA